jgi:putative ABC transport system ATP-binding protein
VSLHLREGDLVFRQGQASDLVYVVQSGSVHIFRELADGGEESLTDIGPAGYFGELGPLLDLPRSASARATSATELTGYGPQQFRARYHR